MDQIRFRIASWLHLQATKIYDDWHEWTLVTEDGKRIHWGHYYQGTGSWPEGLSEECSCKEDEPVE